MCAEMTNPEISTVFVLSNLILLAPIFLKLAKSPLSPFDDVALHCDEVNRPLQKREGTGASFLYWLDWKSKD